jgi:hypothetical protein
MFVEMSIGESGQFARFKSSTISLLDPRWESRGKLTNVYIRQQILLPAAASNDITSFCIQETLLHAVTLLNTLEEWDPQGRVIRIPRESNPVQLNFSYGMTVSFVVLLGIVAGSKGCCLGL